jgi:hypothetical protein
MTGVTKPGFQVRWVDRRHTGRRRIDVDGALAGGKRPQRNGGDRLVVRVIEERAGLTGAGREAVYTARRSAQLEPAVSGSDGDREAQARVDADGHRRATRVRWNADGRTTQG